MTIFSTSLTIIVGCFLLIVNQAFAYVQLENNCIKCHEKQVQQWQLSDHAKSLLAPTESNILANFDNTQITYPEISAEFARKNDRFNVKIVEHGKVTEYAITYAIGYFPLQQYLVKSHKGHLQVLPFSWDSRAKEEGGQRWFVSQSHSSVFIDRFHWSQPLQNWNGMCADCHSQHLVRQFNDEDGDFNTQFSAINVNCLSCHNDYQFNHSKKDRQAISLPMGQWVEKLGARTKQWQGEKRSSQSMEQCFSCHALRTPITDGFSSNDAFLDNFIPTLIAPPLYHADGQIKEEVYVYGSFLQSRMYAKGVLCKDCHNPHTSEVIANGNQLCLQCHDSTYYNSPKHHHHQQTSEGAQCVNCHMPETVYMGVDKRRDHSFSIPRPELSLAYGTPNSCTKCHQNETNAWASQHTSKWYNTTNDLTLNEINLIKLNTGVGINLSEHLSIIADKQISIISRASALALLNLTTNTLSQAQLSQYLTHNEPLIRLGALKSAYLLPQDHFPDSVAKCLTDSYKAIRVQAAKSLLRFQIPSKYRSNYQKAFDELIHAEQLNSWRAESLINRAESEIFNGEPLKAEQLLKKAIKRDPYFEMSYLNLADLYRVMKQPNNVKLTLKQGLKKIPNNDVLHFALGLHYVRQQRLTEAVISLKKAQLLQPQSTQYLYTYLLSLDAIGNTAHASDILKNSISNFQDWQILRHLGMQLSLKLKSPDLYHWFENYHP